MFHYDPNEKRERRERRNGKKKMEKQDEIGKERRKDKSIRTDARTLPGRQRDNQPIIFSSLLQLESFSMYILFLPWSQR